MLDYNYPGNVRELKNIIEDIFVFANRVITTSDLSYEIVNISRDLPLEINDKKT